MPRARWRLGQEHDATGRSIGSPPQPPGPKVEPPEPTSRDRAVALFRLPQFGAISASSRKFIIALARLHEEEGSSDGTVIVVPGALACDGVGPCTIGSGLAEAAAVGLVKVLKMDHAADGATLRQRLRWLPNDAGRMPRLSRNKALASLKRNAAAARAAALLSQFGRAEMTASLDLHPPARRCRT